jgi:S1-C subfamily serine protease
VPQVLRHGRVIRPTLEAQFFPDSISRRLGMTGIVIARVERGGAAAKAGLRSTRRTPFGDILWGDVIIAVNAKPVHGVDDLLTALEAHSIGDTIKLTIMRGLGTADEESLEAPVTLAAEKAE